MWGIEVYLLINTLSAFEYKFCYRKITLILIKNISHSMNFFIFLYNFLKEKRKINTIF